MKILFKTHSIFLVLSILLLSIDVYAQQGVKKAENDRSLIKLGL